MATREDAGEWQTVKSKDKHRKPRETSIKLPPTSVGLPSSIPAFAALDMERRREGNYSQKAGTTRDGSSGKQEAQAQATTVDTLPVGKESTSKKSKARKFPAKDAAVGLPKADEFRATLRSIREQHKCQDAVQLEKFAEIILKAYRDVELPWSVITDGEVEKVTDVALRDFPPDILAEAIPFLKFYETRPLSKFLLEVLEETFESIPVSSSSKGAGSPAKVGHLMIVSLVLRANPACLFELAESILEKGDAWSCSARLPFLFWVFQQADRATAGMAVAAWLRVVLPGLLGTHLPTTKAKSVWHKDCEISKLSESAQQKALVYISQQLLVTPPTLSNPRQEKAAVLSVKKREGGVALTFRAGPPAVSILEQSASSGIVHQDGTQRLIQPVVPPGALEAVLRACYLRPAESTRYKRSLEELYPVLRGLALKGIGNGGFSAEELLKLELETTSQMNGGNPPFDGPDCALVDLVTKNFVECLQAADNLTACWEQRHNLPNCLKGSCQILQHLKRHPDYLEGLAGNPAQRKRLCDMFEGIQQRQKKLLSSPESSWEVACARLADDACLQLRKVLMPSRTTSWRVTWGLLAGVLVVGAAAVALVVAQAEEESWDRFLQNQAVQGKLLAAIGLRSQ